tara:strand:+ start:383 stop:544 length:162 start_codon:yes stop_codon:yes gene_type:complete
VISFIKSLVSKGVFNTSLDLSTDSKIWWAFEGILYLGALAFGLWLGFVLLGGV